jgi:orotidine-5'-phosphate decarboxylase
MKAPKDYIVFPLDVPSQAEAQHYIDLLADQVGMFKVGLELYVACGPEIIEHIRHAGSARVFLDLKLHDIPATVARAMQRIAGLGVAMTTIHCAGSQKMMAAAVKASNGRVAVLGVTVLTSMNADDLKADGFEDRFASDLEALVVHRAAMAQTAGCSGVVCSGLEAGRIKQTLGKAFLAVTPGIRPAWEVTGSDDQQRIVTPARAIQAGADYLVIGRPIRDARAPREAAQRIAVEIDAALQK